MSQKAWVKQPWFWVALGGVVAVFVVIGVTAGDHSKRPRKPSATAGVSPEIQAQIRQSEQNTNATLRAERRILRRDLQKPIGPRTLYYLLRGTASTATVTYQNAAGGSGQRTVNVTSSYRYEYKMPVHPGDFLYMSAQNEGAYGTLTCEIVQSDGRGDHVLNRNTSSGAYAIAECDGTAR